MKKLAFALILILLCTLLPCASAADASAAEQFSYSFENADDANVWSGGVFDDSNSFRDGNAIYVNNPFGEVKNEHATHVLDYSPTISLEAGKVYTLSGYVFNPLSSHSPSVRTSATLGDGANTVIVSVSGIGEEWAEFSTTFYAGESGDYNLSLHFAGGYVDFGFFVDELRLRETVCTLSSLNLTGQSEILIPATGSIKNYYRPYLLTSENRSVDILSSSSVYFSVTPAAGIAFNPQDFSLTVTSEAAAGSTISIDCALRNYAQLSPTSLSVGLTDNMIDNPDFSKENILWTSTSEISAVRDGNNSYISVPTNDYGEFGYFASITYDTPQILLEDVVYVIHAKIKSDNAKPFSAIYAKNSAENKDNTIYFSIKDISGEEWIDVFAAFVPEQSGVYDITLNLCSMYDCTIFVDDIKLSSEVLSAEYLTLHAPGNIALPNVATTYPVSALLRDQLGNILDSEEVQISLLQESSLISFDSASNLLTVNPDTPAGRYTLRAVYLPEPDINAQLDFTVSYDYIGDGSFENTMPNEWWMVSSPYECDFYMRHDGHSRRALINCRGNYFMLLNNSYVHLLANMPYVFNSSFSAPVDCTATLFIETIGGDTLPLAQMFIQAGSTLDKRRLPELFLAEEDAVGRLFLYVESDSGQPFSVYADNLSLKSASILAVNPRVTGIPYVNGAVEAEFSLFNNIAENSDTSACVVNWYVSSTPYGQYKEVPSAGKNIYFDTTFLNKYVYFRVTPVCPVTGFSGTTVRCMPFLVTYAPQDDENAPAQFTPVITENTSAGNHFSDIDDHWGRDYINALAQSGVVDGENTAVFAPERAVTRAEFAKMLSSAFSINTVADFAQFSDVSRTDWFYKHVTALNLAGIVNGTSPDTFSPGSTLTREEASVMAVRLYEKATLQTALQGENRFTDRKNISPWAAAAADKAVSLGVVQGNPDGTFAPQEQLTRAEAAALIYRLSDILRNKIPE